MALAIFYLLNGLVWIAIISSLGFWAKRLLLTRRRGERSELVPLQGRDRPRWSLAEFLVMFGLMIIIFSILTLVFRNQGYLATPAPDVLVTESMTDQRADTDVATTTVDSDADPASNLIALLLANSLAAILAMSVTLLWLRHSKHVSITHLGLIPDRHDIALGLKAAFWFLPPVLLVSLAASFFIPYEHPVLETLATTRMPGAWFLLFLGTAIIAPITEEFMFRVLLQGGLQKLADPKVTTGATSSLELQSGVAADSENWIAGAYQPPGEISMETTLSPAQADSNQAWLPRAIWPLLVTSVVFAMMHGGQGAAPVPLFFLSIGLGYLYRQTGRITPSLIVHMVLNSLTLSVEFSRMAAGLNATTGI
ncbi:MAG: CPBP family intramembrane metalloprotease [Pirellulaceae bacterium]|nr:CPBP family intramembrane metalloprotease [Pirellulaceae bacterium]